MLHFEWVPLLPPPAALPRLPLPRLHCYYHCNYTALSLPLNYTVTSTVTNLHCHYHCRHQCRQDHYTRMDCQCQHHCVNCTVVLPLPLHCTVTTTVTTLHCHYHCNYTALSIQGDYPQLCNFIDQLRNQCDILYILKQKLIYDHFLIFSYTSFIMHFSTAFCFFQIFSKNPKSIFKSHLFCTKICFHASF